MLLFAYGSSDLQKFLLAADYNAMFRRLENLIPSDASEHCHPSDGSEHCHPSSSLRYYRRLPHLTRLLSDLFLKMFL